ncbi:MAG: hypothetical protein KKA84_01805 [Bacteroidetes bacterium]|nr:hypothetical protein [Bacteroidota bacterium]
MTSKFTVLLFVFALSLSNILLAQDSDTHHHHDSDYELGFSFGLNHLVEENETPLSAHIHLLRKLGDENIWERIALGLGYEHIFSEHTHYSVVGTISINPIWHFVFDVSPGVLITEHEGSNESQFVTHIELTYEFEVGEIGIGPVVGYGVSSEDNHYTIGLHIGIGL